eukprot:scaffold2995_cov135-Skeletonema_menzelii.AAC.7
MPTGFYSDDEAISNNDGPLTSSSVNNNTIQLTHKQSKQHGNDNDDNSSDDCSIGSTSSVVATVTKSHEEDIMADDENNYSDNGEEAQWIIGTSIVPLLNSKADSNADDKLNSDNNTEEAGRWCWSCFIHLSNNSSCYTIHEHPLLSIPVCSICNERAEAVESEVIDDKLKKRRDVNDGVQEEEEVNACSWCGLTTFENDTSSHSTSSMMENNKTIVGIGINPIQSSTIYLDNISLADGGSNELLLCDNCPRGMCVKCCTVALGGTVDALKVVRHVCSSSSSSSSEEEEGEWKCCYCNPTEFLERLREEYRLVCGEGDDDDDNDDRELMKKNTKKEEDGAMDVEKDDNSKHDDDDDATTDEDEKVARLIEELNTAEDELSTAQQMLSRAEIEQTRHEIESELLSSSSSSLVVGLEDLTEAVEAEVADYLQKWQRKFDLCQDEIGRLQEELEEGGVQLVQYYKFRNEERKRLRRQDGSDDDDDDYARRAEMALGEFRN